jgi:hypothetical protein
MKTFLKQLIIVVAFLLLALGWLLLPGCSTVAPKPVAAAQGSFDATPDAHGNYQNSGVLGFTNHQVVITATARARYNALCGKWGTKFIPPVVPPDAGLTPLGTNGLWLMDKDHLDKWATMTGWQRQPPTTLAPQAGVHPP